MSNNDRSSTLAGLASVALAITLAGCATSIAPAPKVNPGSAVTTMPAITPSASATVKAGLSIDRWWTLFDDAALERLMDEALARNEDLESAVARVREAQASLDAVHAARSPTLDADVRSDRSQRSAVGATPLPSGVAREAPSHRASLNAAYDLDLWGRLASSTESARKQLLATEWARAAIEWRLTAQLAEAYFNLAATDRQIEISEAVRESRNATLDLRKRELSAGAGTELDVRRAEAELIATDSTLVSLARQRISLIRALTALLGRTPAEVMARELPRKALNERESLATVLPQGSAADLLVKRPDIRQAEAQLAASNASIEAARAATLPTIRLSGSLGSDAKSIANLFSGPAAIWSIAAGTTQAIFDGGKLQARVREEHARAEQAFASYRKAITAAVLEVREAYATLDLAHQGHRTERDRVASLGRARDLAKRGYENGALNYLDLLDAERNWYQAQLQQVTLYRDQLVGQVAAFKALGGGYTPVQANAY